MLCTEDYGSVPEHPLLYREHPYTVGPQLLLGQKEASGLSWRGLARALGVDPKQLARWRKGVEPCGGAMHSIHRFASRIPGGTEILMGDDFQLGLFDEEEPEDEDGVNAAEDREADDEEDQNHEKEEEEEG